MNRDFIDQIRFTWKDEPVKVRRVKVQSRLRDSAIFQKSMRLLFVLFIITISLMAAKYTLEGMISFYKGVPHTSMHEFAKDFEQYRKE
jgi:hypothetical protein